MKFNSNFWNGKKIFITGHTGFKGSWLSLWLLKLGAKVAGFSLEPATDPALFHVLDISKEVKSTIDDVRNRESLLTSIREFNPDIVFHLAAQPLVRQSYTDPVKTFETNIMGTVNILETVRSIANVRAVLCVTSDKCYENREQIWGYRETDPMGGYDPYSASKGCAELVIASYRNSFFHAQNYNKTHMCAIASARAGNVIGGGDWSPDRLIPDCIRSLSKNEIIILRNPRATRPWQHVFEPLLGYLGLAELLFEKGPDYGEAWNFGPTDCETMCVEDITKKIIALWGSGAYKVDSQKHLHEAITLRLDTSKTRTRIGIKTVFSIDSAFTETIRWYKDFYHNNDRILDFSIKQLNDFERLLNESD